MNGIKFAACFGFVLCLGAFAGAGDGPGEWDPATIEGGFMFKDLGAFRSYLLGAEGVAVGRLTAWDGRQGRVRVEKVFRGAPDTESAFKYSGGLVTKLAKGDKVLILLRKREGQVALHSFCAASGLFTNSERLEKLVMQQFAVKE